MATDRIGKVYAGLTARERAALVFASLARCDKKEADRIQATVPFRTYRMQDEEYWERLRNLRDMAFLWGLEHWREMAKLTASFGLLIHVMHGDNEELADQALGTLQEAEGRLLALDAILQSVCEANGIDPETVRHFADVRGPYTPMGLPDEIGPRSDGKFDATMRGMLSKLAG